MYDIGTYEDFKRLIAELNDRYNEEKPFEWGYYPNHSKLMYEAMKKYIEENYEDDE